MATRYKHYLLRQYSDKDLQHGGIGYTHLENILLRNGFKQVKLPFHTRKSLYGKFRRFLAIWQVAMRYDKRSIVFFQHPVYARMNRMLINLLRLRSAKLVCIISDIDGLKSSNLNLLAREQKWFRRFRYFIVHNENMKSWLLSFHPEAQCTLLNCFDFSVAFAKKERTRTNNIAFAGNLAKSGFIKHLHTIANGSSSLSFQIYGPGLPDSFQESSRVRYLGTHAPDKLPALLEGSFGLIWDGESVHRPEGSFGDYMHFISHHKLSLYIVAGLPVIVYSDAGSARFVEQNEIGIVVDDLAHLEAKIRTVTESAYQRMVQNMVVLARKITMGDNIVAASMQIISMIEQNAGKKISS
jgi:glycosyltransferase involved in cell wall biosynthesis